jgi:hypothetical protein
VLAAKKLSTLDGLSFDEVGLREVRDGSMFNLGTKEINDSFHQLP